MQNGHSRSLWSFAQEGLGVCLSIVPAAGPPQITVVNYFATWSSSWGSNARQLPLAETVFRSFPLYSAASEAVKSGAYTLSQCDLPSKHKQGKQREEEAAASDWKNNESILPRPSERLWVPETLLGLPEWEAKKENKV